MQRRIRFFRDVFRVDAERSLIIFLICLFARYIALDDVVVVFFLAQLVCVIFALE